MNNANSKPNMPQRQTRSGSYTAVYSDCQEPLSVLDVHDGLARKNLVTAGLDQDYKIEVVANAQPGIGRVLNFGSWLKPASKALCISDRLEDYVLSPVPAIVTELPNRNCVGFPLDQLTCWNTDQGRVAYESWIGKPMHIEHDNLNPEKAIGVIADAQMMPLARRYGGGRLWALVLLAAIDRSKDPYIAAKVVTREINTYSMGAWVKSFRCSVCNAPFFPLGTIGARNCSHLNAGKKTDFYLNIGQLVYRLCVGVKGFELSVVKTPAYAFAMSDTLMDFNYGGLGG